MLLRSVTAHTHVVRRNCMLLFRQKSGPFHRTNFYAFLHASVVVRVRGSPLFQFTLKLSESVAVIHSLGIVHADLHPANVFVFKELGVGYRIVLGDFGQSVDFSDADQVAGAATVSEDDAVEDPQVGQSLPCIL